MDDKNFEGDFEISHEKIQGGVIAYEYSTRFKTFKSLSSQSWKTPSQSFQPLAWKVVNLISDVKTL